MAAILGVVTSLTALEYFNDILLHWWQYINLIYITLVTLILPLLWVFSCLALTKVANALADDIEKVRN
jgi:hypothetical protein